MALRTYQFYLTNLDIVKDQKAAVQKDIEQLVQQTSTLVEQLKALDNDQKSGFSATDYLG